MTTAFSGPCGTDRPAREAAGPVLGVDPGLVRTGYAVLSQAPAPLEVRLIEAGLLRLDRNRPLAQRLVALAEGLESLIRTHRPGVLACEELYTHYEHPRTAILMAHARGAILTVAAGLGLPIVSVGATQVKKLLTGSGRAGKQQVQAAVAATLGLARLPEPHDVADAMAIALCGLQLRRAEQVVAEALMRSPTASGRRRRPGLEEVQPQGSGETQA